MRRLIEAISDYLEQRKKQVTTQAKSAWEIYFSVLQCFSVRSEYISLLSHCCLHLLTVLHYLQILRLLINAAPELTHHPIPKKFN